MKNKSAQKIGRPFEKYEPKILMGKAIGNLYRWMQKDAAHRCIVVYRDDKEMVLCYATVNEEGSPISATPLAYLVDPLDMSRMGSKQPKDMAILFLRDILDFDLRLFNPMEKQ